MGKFVVRCVDSGIKFDLKAANGSVIATSEVYNSKVSCLRGIASVAKYAQDAAIEDQTVESFEKQKHPKFELFRDRGGEYRFHLKAANGKVIAVSESYPAKASCQNGICSVKKNAQDAPITYQEA